MQAYSFNGMAEQAASSDIPLRLVLTGTLIASIAYGLLSAIFFGCLTLLITNKKKAYTNRVRSFLTVYIATMFLFSTATIVQAFVYIVKAVIGDLEPTAFTPKVNAPITLPLAIWGLDGIMVCQLLVLFILYFTHPYSIFQLWRCVVLFVDESHFHRILLSLILGLCGCLSFGELGG